MNSNHTEMISVDVTPRIYVASLSDYNAGTLHGRWIDAAQDVDGIWQEVQAMLAESEEDFAEEWAIHDYENFGDLRLSEWESFGTVSEVARLIVEHGPVFANLLDYFGGTSALEEAKRAMDAGHGAFQSLADYAEWCVEDGWGMTLENVPAFIRNNIDYEGIGRDLELSGDVFTIEVDGAVHVFPADF